MFQRLFRLTSPCISVFVAVVLLAITASANTQSFTGTFLNSTDIYLHTFVVNSAGTVSVQTYGFGGGVNAAGTVVPSGGFDPLIALFDSAGSIVLINGDINNPAGTSDLITNYAPFQGCPPAGLVTIGADQGCGDIYLSLNLVAGNYKLLLSDAAYIPYAIFYPDTAKLSDGFGDLTAGVFQTCTLADCVERTGDWAFDLTVPDSGAPTVPEPSAAILLCAGSAIAWWRRRHG